MSFIRILWDDRDDPDGNVQHVAEHGLDIVVYEEVDADTIRVVTAYDVSEPH